MIRLVPIWNWHFNNVKTEQSSGRLRDLPKSHGQQAAGMRLKPQVPCRFPPGARKGPRLVCWVQRVPGRCLILCGGDGCVCKYREGCGGCFFAKVVKCEPSLCNESLHLLLPLWSPLPYYATPPFFWNLGHRSCISARERKEKRENSQNHLKVDCLNDMLFPALTLTCIRCLLSVKIPSPPLKKSCY